MKRTYSTREVANLLRITEFRVRRYAKAALGTTPSGDALRGPWRFDFRDVLVIKMACRIAARGFPHAHIERALVGARGRLPPNQPLCTISLEEEGGQIVVRDTSGTWSAETGQRELAFAASAASVASSQVDSLDLPPLPGPKRSLSRDLFGVLGDGSSAHDWFELALKHEDQDPQQAYDAYLRTLALDPEHVEAMINIGRLCSVAGESERAAAYFRQAIRTDPSQPVAHFNLGVTLHDLRDVHGAIVAYRTALIHDAHFADAHFNLAALLEELGDSEEAIKHRNAYEVACQRPT